MKIIIIRNGRLAVRKLTDTDKGLLYKWLNDPAVLEFYEGRDRPQTMDDIEKNFYRDFEETPCIVEYDGVAIGYSQFYPISIDERREYGYGGSRETIYGMDQFIGEPERWNKGIGTLLVKSVAEYLAKELGADRVVMDPQSRNVRAIACYEKCGFKKTRILREHEMHEGEMRDCQIVEWTRTV